MQSNFIDNVSKVLQAELPGEAAQLKMANAFRKTRPSDPNDVRIASVLLLLYQKDKNWYFPLIQRTSDNPNDRHGGQISFPGGKREESDQDLSETALREAEEEIGVQQKDIQLLGKLTPLYIPVSNFMVHPFVGYLPYPPQFKRQELEVVKVLETSLSELQNTDNHKQKDIALRQGIRLKEVPYFELQQHTVWGATAMMLSEWLAVIENMKTKHVNH
ncbi:MAG: CoA pyrophosphatase [Bacteroidota bacterium]